MSMTGKQCSDDCGCNKSAFKTALRILGVGILIGAAIGVSTKRFFDEIMVDDDWSDDDWGEGDDSDVETFYVVD